MLNRLVCLLIISCLPVLTAQTGLATQNSTTPKSLLFDKAPTTLSSVDVLPQWRRVIEDYALIQSLPPSNRVTAWNRFIDSVQHDLPVRQILKVNLWFNGYPYKQDNWLYDRNDHWATPTEFLQTGGDCEDYAIIKYLTLRRLGFAAATMRIVMVYDVFSGTDHAFLTVRHDGEIYVLDNRDGRTIEAHYVDRYKPHYAFNEHDLWTYERPVMVETLRDDQQDVLTGNR